MAIKVDPSILTAPGPWLRRNFMEPYHLTVQGTAAALGVNLATMSNLLIGKAALSAEMASRFEQAFGVSAETLMRMQTAYDLAQAREHSDELIAQRNAKQAQATGYA